MLSTLNVPFLSTIYDRCFYKICNGTKPDYFELKNMSFWKYLKMVDVISTKFVL